MTGWQGLMANLALVGLAIVIWSYIEDRFEESARSAKQLAVGLVTGASVVAIMSMPVTLAPGLFFDLRAALIAVTAFYSGPLTGAIATIVASAYRLSIGGVGAFPGMAGIVLAFCAGLAVRRLASAEDVRLMRMLLLGASAAAANLLGLLLLPKDVLASTLGSIAVPASILTVAGTLFAGLVLRTELRRRALSRSNRIFRSIVEALPDCLNVKDMEGRFLAANSATARLMGAASAEALIGKSDFDFYDIETATAFRTNEAPTFTEGTTDTFEQTIPTGPGRTTTLSTLKAPMRDEKGEIVGIITHNRDISKRKELERQLAQARGRLDIALDHMADGLVMFDPNGEILMCNERYRDLFPKTAPLRMPGARIADVIRASVEVGEETVGSLSDLELLLADNCAVVRRAGSNMIRLDGDRWIETRTRVLDDGNSVTVLSDMTQRKRFEDALSEANSQLQNWATTDGLTSLANRRSFDETFAKEFRRSSREGTSLGLLIADVDHFKKYNDFYGHPTGDECLRRVSRILEASVRRPGDTAVRYGGEEFAAILPNTDREGALHIAERFRSAIEQEAMKHPSTPSGLLSVSVGVTARVAGQQPGDQDLMISEADQALYRAKRNGRNRVVPAWIQEVPARQDNHAGRRA